jgi:hypothetical protein
MTSILIVKIQVFAKKICIMVRFFILYGVLGFEKSKGYTNFS